MRTIGQIVDAVCIIETWLIIARVIISWFPSIDYWNPLVRALLAVTDPVLRVFRPILPTFAGIDLSPILAIITLRLVGDAFGNLGAGYTPTYVIVDIIGQVILTLIIIAVVVVFLQVVMGFFRADPWHPATRMVRDMARPLTAPFGAASVRSRHVDVPAMIALAVYVVAYFLVQALFNSILGHV